MNVLELVISERNRLVRMATFTCFVGIVFALWARDPYLTVSLPLSGPEAGNLTAGHIVLVGHPLYCLLFLLLVLQVLRYDKLLFRLPLSDMKHLDWKPRVSKKWPLRKRIFARFNEFPRLFALAFVPMLMGTLMYSSTFQFYMCGDVEETMRSGSCCYENYLGFEWKKLRPLDLVIEEFPTIKPAFSSLRHKNECHFLSSRAKEACQEREMNRIRILLRMPKLYWFSPLVNAGFFLVMLFAFFAIVLRWCGWRRRLRTICR